MPPCPLWVKRDIRVATDCCFVAISVALLRMYAPVYAFRVKKIIFQHMLKNASARDRRDTISHPLTTSRWTSQRPPNRETDMWKSDDRDELLDRVYVRFCGRYWGQSGHGLLRCICRLMTQGGHFRLLGAHRFFWQPWLFFAGRVVGWSVVWPQS